MSLQTKKFAFNEFHLDVDERVLILDGKPVALTPKAFHLLRVLVENPGRIMDKDELMRAVWPDSFVEESNLTFTINALRKALGDDRRSPRFIETISRRGYRFVAEVAEVVPPLEVPPAATPAVVVKQVSSRRRLGTWVATVTIGVAVIVAGLWFWLGFDSAASVPILAKPFSVEQLSNTGQSRYATISPDGKVVVFSMEAAGRQSLWIRYLENSDTVQIIPPSEDEYLGMTFSNDGKSLFFVRKSIGVHSLPSLYRIEPFGGIPSKIVNFVNERVSISPDDKKMAFIRCRYRKDDFCAAYIADINGDNEQKLTATQNGIHIWEIEYSPDGRSIAIGRGRYANDKNDSGVFALDIATGQETELFTERFTKITGIDWLANDSGILFSAEDFRDSKASIWMVSRTGGKLTQVTRDAASYFELSVDRGMEKLVAVQRTPNFRIQTATSGSIRSLTAAREIATSFGSDKLIYSGFDGEVWSMNADGSEQRQITKSKANEMSLFLSPDGKSIYFSSDEGNAREIWVMNTDGTDRRQLTQGNGGFVVGLSGDSKQLYFIAAVGWRLYRLPTAGGQPELIFEGTVVNPSVSPSERYVAHFKLEGMTRNIVVTDLNTQQVVKTVVPEAGAIFARMLTWSADGTRLAYVSSYGGRNSLWETTVDGVPSKVADISEGEVLSFTAPENGLFQYVSGNWNSEVMLLRGLK